MKHLEESYKDILNFKIEARKINSTFFDISQFAHFENTITNWYSFFFNDNAEHSLKTLFLDSLIQLINEKDNTSEFFMDSCQTIREYYTGNGSIDLILFDGDENKMNNAIIIENKVKAGLANDLDDYFSSIKCQKSKIGVLLSLKKMDPQNENFINITHQELLKTVEDNIGNYWKDANDKYVLYLKDFVNNIYGLTAKLKMTDNIKFYMKHVDQVDQLIEIRKEAFDYLYQTLAQKCKKSQYFNIETRNNSSIVLTEIDSGLRIYLFNTEIYKQQLVDIELWAKGKILDKFSSSVKQKIEELNESIEINFYYQGKTWLHIGSKKYENLNNIEIENFGSYFMEKLENEWLELINHVKKMWE